MIKRRPFTPQDDALIRTLAGQGCGYTDIGNRLGRHYSSIQNRAAKLGVRVAPNTPGAKRLAERPPIPPAILDLAISKPWRNPA